MFFILKWSIFQKWGTLFGIFLFVTAADSIIKILENKRKRLKNLKRPRRKAYAENELIQKMGFLFLVGCAFLLDELMEQMTKALGWEMELTVMGGITLIWLILNEVVSIFDNLEKIGVPIPAYLHRFLQELKRIVNAKTTNGRK